MMNEITTFISTVGFPIVACVFMFKQLQDTNKVISDLNKTLTSIDTRIDMLEKGAK